MEENVQWLYEREMILRSRNHGIRQGKHLPSTLLFKKREGGEEDLAFVGAPTNPIRQRRYGKSFKIGSTFVHRILLRPRRGSPTSHGFGPVRRGSRQDQAHTSRLLCD